MNNTLKIYTDRNSFSEAEFTELKSYHWESSPPYRPRTFFKIGLYGNSLKAILKCYEKEPKAVYTNRDEPVYKDSCLEFFVAPVDGRKEYINIECNSNGAFLSEFGVGRGDRRLVSTATTLSPIVEPFSGEDDNGSYWGVEITLTRGFVAELYSADISEITFKSIKANFYKCGDDCEIAHYLAFSPVNTLPPGFHNPECFATFKTEDL